MHLGGANAPQTQPFLHSTRLYHGAYVSATRGNGQSSAAFSTARRRRIRKNTIDSVRGATLYRRLDDEPWRLEEIICSSKSTNVVYRLDWSKTPLCLSELNIMYEVINVKRQTKAGALPSGVLSPKAVATSRNEMVAGTSRRSSLAESSISLSDSTERRDHNMPPRIANPFQLLPRENYSTYSKKN